MIKEFWTLILMRLFIAVLGIVLFIVGIAQFVEKPMAQKACAVFSRESGREVKFVEYTSIYFDCLTPQSNGKWISATLLREDN